MHILLAYPNKPRITFGYLPGPYGLETIRAQLSHLAVDCEIVNPFLSLDPRDSIGRAIRLDTALIGISVRNLDDALVLWNPDIAGGRIQTQSCIDDVRDVVDWVRHAAPGVPIVLGGAAFGHMADRLLPYLGAEVGLSGAAERDFLQLVTGLVEGRRFDEVVRELPNAVFRNPAVRPRPDPVGGAARERVPVIDRDSTYFRFRPEAAVRTFSGCPLSCAHCIEHVGSRRIARSPIEAVADEVEGTLERYPEVRRIFFADSEINLGGEERTTALMHEIRRRPGSARVPLVGYFNPRPISRPFLETLQDTGCEVRLTVDHVADPVLSRNGKNFRSRHLRTLVSHYADLGMELSFCLLLGQPGETRKTVDEVLDFVASIPGSIRGPMYFSPGVRVYPGTPIERGLQDGTLDRRWLSGPEPVDHPFVKPLIYCESWDPFELFAHVLARGEGMLRPMNAYLGGLDAAGFEQVDGEFRAYHIGLAAMERDEVASRRAWSAIRADAPFLTLKQRIEFLWTRGRLALQQGSPRQAEDDWTCLQSILEASRLEGRGSDKLQHNIAVARSMAAASR